MATDSSKRITNLPIQSANELEQQAPNPARAVQGFVGEVLGFISKPLDLLNFGAAKFGQWTGLDKLFGSRPAARLYRDYVLGLPHSHLHFPTFGVPLPSVGVVVCAGARN